MPTPPELDRLQAFLGDAFRREAPLPETPELIPACVEHVAGNSKLSPAQQADIYRRQFWLRHLDSLTEDYPGLQYLLGEEAFEAFSRAYLAACPPRKPSLRDLGIDVIAFAERYPDIDPALRSAALEMVRYENAFVDLFDGAEPPPLDPQKLATLPEDAWERARIVLHPLLHLFDFVYPVHRLRLEASRAEAPLAAPLAKAPVRVALYRAGEIIRFEELDATAFALLSALGRGEALVPACDRLAADLDPAAAEALGAQVGAWFQQWTAHRWIIDVVLDDAPASAGNAS
ncbi:MAG: DNA-binding domain-containing protein [Minicystis sp.]